MCLWLWERAPPTQLVGGIRYFGCYGTRGSGIDIIVADSLDSALVLADLDFNVN